MALAQDDPHIVMGTPPVFSHLLRQANQSKLKLTIPNPEPRES